MIHERINPFSLSVVEFRNVFFFGNQTKTFFFILLRVYYIKQLFCIFIFYNFKSFFYFFIWQILFFLIVYVLSYKRIEFLICPKPHSIFQDKFVLENHHSIDADHSTAHCLFRLEAIDTIIFPQMFKPRLCWTLLLAWMFQQLQHHRTFIQTINSPDGLRPNNNQTRQLWLNNPMDFPDQPAVDWLLNKYETQPTTKFPCLFFGIKRFFLIFV